MTPGEMTEADGPGEMILEVALDRVAEADEMTVFATAGRLAPWLVRMPR
jgi:hypothetical protein